jgi:hypothetical protein
VTCALCATRGRTTRLEHGHVCAVCLTRIADHLDDIVRLAALASIEPRNSRGGGRTVPGSRPPLNVDGIDPALTLVRLGGAWATVLETLESWERLVREARQMAPYGVASESRGRGALGDTGVTLTGCTGFLRASLPWWESNQEQPIDDFASEIHACQRALAHYDPDREPLGYGAYCPTDGCGARLRYQHADDEVRCPRCQVVRDVPQLVSVILSDPDCHDIWADVETAAQHYGISVSTLKRRALNGDIERRRGRYLIRRVALSSQG